MIIAAKAIGALALIATVAAPLFYVTGRLSLDASHVVLLIGTAAWFASAAGPMIAGNGGDVGGAATE